MNILKMNRDEISEYLTELNFSQFGSYVFNSGEESERDR